MFLLCCSILVLLLNYLLKLNILIFDENKTRFVIDISQMCKIQPITISDFKKLMLLKTCALIDYFECSIFENRMNIIRLK